MTRSEEMEMLVETIMYGPASRDQIEAYVRESERMRRRFEAQHMLPSEEAALRAYDRAKRRLLDAAR